MFCFFYGCMAVCFIINDHLILIIKNEAVTILQFTQFLKKDDFVISYILRFINYNIVIGK